MKVKQVIVVASFVWLVVAFWHRNELPGNIVLVDDIARDPEQRKSALAPFQANWDGLDYQVEPQYDYDLTGMIVSYRHHNGNSRLHALSEDHLNMLDVCVVWGDSAANPYLDRIDFWNGIFTCNFQTRDREAWEAFDGTQISNNHLISDDPYIRDRVGDIRIGDQIRVRGQLASYVSPSGSRRGTSTTREDTGDGACETIYVDEFDIVRPATSYWRWSMYVALLTFLASLVTYLWAPHKPY